MNAAMPLLITTLVLAVSSVLLAIWAMAERGRARQAELKVQMLEAQSAGGADILKAQAALSANAVADELVKRATETFQAQDRLAREIAGAGLGQHLQG